LDKCTKIRAGITYTPIDGNQLANWCFFDNSPLLNAVFFNQSTIKYGINRDSGCKKLEIPSVRSALWLKPPTSGILLSFNKNVQFFAV
jgi:hypothetical protein